MADHTSTARMARRAEALHRAGPRALAEFLTEFAGQHDCAPDMLAALDAWARLDPDMLCGVLRAYCGGRQFPRAIAEVPTDA